MLCDYDDCDARLKYVTSVNKKVGAGNVGLLGTGAVTLLPKSDVHKLIKAHSESDLGLITPISTWAKGQRSN